MCAFAKTIERLNFRVARRLSNASCVFNGGQPFGVVFDKEAADALGVIGGYSPSCSFCVANAPGLEQGGQLVIDGQPFEVVSPVEPDASGWATLQLREVAHG